MSDPHKYVIGIVGATGAVGVELIKCLEGRNFPVDDLRLFASAKSAGKVVDTFLGEKLIEEFEVPKARECHFVFLAVSGEFALEYAPKIVANNGPYVIDNSSAFRYISDIPLVVSLFLNFLYSVSILSLLMNSSRFLRSMLEFLVRKRG